MNLEPRYLFAEEAKRWNAINPTWAKHGPEGLLVARGSGPRARLGGTADAPEKEQSPHRALIGMLIAGGLFWLMTRS